MSRLKLKRGPTAPLSGPRPVILGQPSISGEMEVGQTLVPVNGLYDHSPILSYAYGWVRDGEIVSTAATYPLTEDDLGSIFEIRELAQNANGWSDPNISVEFGPVVSATTGLQVGPDWEGVANEGFETIPDPEAARVLRLITGSKQQPTVHLAYGQGWRVVTGDIDIMAQCELIDLNPIYPTFGRPIALEVTFMLEGGQSTKTSRSTRGDLNLLTDAPWSAYGFWETMKLPATRFSTPGGPGAQMNLYIRARATGPGASRFAERIEGPFPFFPKDAADVVDIEVHKTETVSATVKRNPVDVLNEAVSHFEASGKAVRGLCVDKDKKWVPGRRSEEYTAIPWHTEYLPGVDRITGTKAFFEFGEEGNYPNQGYWSPGLNHLWYRGFKHDVGLTGGIQSRSAASAHIVISDHETWYSSAPASATIFSTYYARYGSGSGAAALIRGRQASGNSIKGSGGLPRLESYNGYFHDLPGKGLDSFFADFNNVVDNVSGSVIENAHGFKYGGLMTRFGGFYSGITTRADDVNLGMRYTGFADLGYAFVGIKVLGNVGGPRTMTLHVGASRAAAEATGPLEGLSLSIPSNRRLDEHAADFNTMFGHLGLAAEDIHDKHDLDATHLWRADMDQSNPIAQIRDDNSDGTDEYYPYQIVGNVFEAVVHADVHANGDAWATSVVMMNISRRDCAWYGYCGSGEIAISGSQTFYDTYYVGCTWWNDMGYYNRKGNWQDIGAQGGRILSKTDGVGFSHCVIAGGGSLFTSSGVKTQSGYGYCYGRFGVLMTGWAATGLVENTHVVPVGATNSKKLKNLITDPRYDDTITYPNGPTADVVPTSANTNTLLPDGVNHAGKFTPAGVDMSRIDWPAAA